MTRKKEEVIVEDEKKEHPSESESLNRMRPKLEKNKTIDILNNIKSFSSLKKFTICSVFLSIILLFLPWIAEVSPINIVDMKNEILDIINLKNIPFTFNLFFNLGLITSLFLVVTIFTIYNGSYTFAGALQFLNIIIVVFVIWTNYSNYKKGELESLIEDKIEDITARKSFKTKKRMVSEVDEVFDYYGFSEKDQWNWMFKIMWSPEEQEKQLENMKNTEHLNRKEKRKIKRKFFDWNFSIVHLTPIFFVILFFTNCILIFMLLRRKRLEISR
ncbi:hypothetical protein OAJ56_02415 [Flavobacteriales bacterium]|nr:hypothetical protein [Flavobacteriales bacterium]